MTIRKNYYFASLGQSTLLQRRLIYGLTLSSLVGCSSINSMMEPNRIDYKSAAKAPTLEIPPDLTQLQRDNRYTIPEANRGVATASSYSQQSSPRQTTQPSSVVPKELASGMRVERSGNQRWLVINQSPEILWPQIKDFWQDSGFLISLELPDAGVMETDWAENRAKIPQDFIRSTLGKAIDSLYSTGERDKFRTRLERATNGVTEIYISHRGAQEVLVGQQKESTVWTPRPSDPELEAEFLSRLMARLGVEEVRAKSTVVNAVQLQSRAKLIKGSNGSSIEINEEFDRSWRRVGLALDRVGFTVEDRDRSQGLYFVRYVNQEQEAQSKSAAEKGLFSRLFSFGSSDDKGKSAQRYRVLVKEAGSSSRVTVLNNDGGPDTSATGDKILSLLSDQLK